MRALMVLSSKTLLLAAVAASLFLFSACNKERTPAAGGHAAAAGELPEDATVASFTGGRVTGAEVNSQTNEKVYQLRHQTAEQLVMEAVVKAEAKKAGIPEDELLKREIEQKAQNPSDAEVKQLYDQAKAQGQIPEGMTLDDPKVKEQVVAAVSSQLKQERAKTFFEDLRKRYNIQVLVPQPRVSVEAKGPSRGPENAKITIIEFSDFQCPFCGKAYETVEQVMQTYAGKVRLVFRNFPLSFHPYAQKAAEASMCANEQGKFWQYYETLFKNQQKLTVADLKDHAKSLGLDSAKFDKCLDGGEKASVVAVDQAAGQKVGVQGTPAFFINGVMLSGAQPIEEFKRVIDQELAQK
jgi:protein-disulfide isomerase